MAQKKQSKNVKVSDLKPSKNPKGGRKAGSKQDIERGGASTQRAGVKINF
jgi:hypothetical protein